MPRFSRCSARRSTSQQLATAGGPLYATRPLGAHRGNLTYARFFVIGDVPDDLPGFAVKRVRANAQVPLDPDEDVSERHGWASADDPFDTDLDHGKLFFNEYMVVSLRLDRWIIPGPLFKAHFREAEQKILEKKSLEKLGRKAKLELKALVTKKLRHRLVPVTKSFDLVWNRKTNMALFFSHAGRPQELVQELFEKTFKLQLLVESPGTAAYKTGLSREEQRQFADLEPTSLARKDSAGGVA